LDGGPKIKAYELPLKLTEEGKFDLPADLAAELPRSELLRVIILIPEPADRRQDAVWDHLTAQEFLAGYSEADSVYDTI
jgi:hypothetical protein